MCICWCCQPSRYSALKNISVWIKLNNICVKRSSEVDESTDSHPTPTKISASLILVSTKRQLTKSFQVSLWRDVTTSTRTNLKQNTPTQIDFDKAENTVIV